MKGKVRLQGSVSIKPTTIRWSCGEYKQQPDGSLQWSELQALEAYHVPRVGDRFVLLYDPDPIDGQEREARYRVTDVGHIAYWDSDDTMCDDVRVEVREVEVTRPWPEDTTEGGTE